MKIVDLTLPLYTGMPVFPGDPEVSIEPIQTYELQGWNMRRLQLNSHDGTHVNVPIHGTASGKNLDDYRLDDFCGPAQIYLPDVPMSPENGIFFRDQNIDEELAAAIKKVRPRFIGLSYSFEFNVDIEKDLLEAGIISYERIANLGLLPLEFDFYGMPLHIKNGDGSPVRAFALVQDEVPPTPPPPAEHP